MRGAKQWKAGVLLIDGYWFTDGTPQNQWNLPLSNYQAPAKKRREEQKRFDARSDFAFRPMGPMKDAKLRLRGPACPSSKVVNSLGVVTRVYGVTVRCINSEFHHLLPRTLPRTTCTKGVACGCAKTLVIRMDTLPASYEPTLFGTTNWAHAKGRRSAVESYNAAVQHQYRATRHSIQVRARKFGLCDALLTFALLLKALYNWIVRLGAWVVRPSEYEGLGALHPTVISAALARVFTPPTSEPPPQT